MASNFFAQLITDALISRLTGRSPPRPPPAEAEPELIPLSPKKPAGSSGAVFEVDSFFPLAAEMTGVPVFPVFVSSQHGPVLGLGCAGAARGFSFSMPAVSQAAGLASIPVF